MTLHLHSSGGRVEVGVLFMYDGLGAVDGSMYRGVVFINAGVALVGYGDKREELKGKALDLLFS